MRVIAAVCVLLAFWGGSGPVEALDEALFPVPDGLETAVAFWTRVFSHYRSDQEVVHDALELDLIYGRVELAKTDEPGLDERAQEQRRRKAARTVVEDVERALEELGTGRPASRPEVTRIVERAWADRTPTRSDYLEAAERVRGQRGLRDEFVRAVSRAARLLPRMEAHFRSVGLPIELTRLPFVESMFQEGVRSHAGAGGIWQIMPETGRPYLRIDKVVDERYDPLHATRAAGELLGQSYRSLGSWPLALTAYNYGLNGMRRAVASLGTTDLGEIVRSHRSRLFGFASRNFYAEFVAAAVVYETRAERFGSELATLAPPLRYEEALLSQHTDLPALGAAAGLDLEPLRLLNPALNEGVWTGRLLFPAGYMLRVPPGSLTVLAEILASPSGGMVSSQPGGGVHVVVRGDTLVEIAHRYGTCVAAISRTNGLRRPDQIFAGQRLEIPDGC